MFKFYFKLLRNFFSIIGLLICVALLLFLFFGETSKGRRDIFFDTLNSFVGTICDRHVFPEQAIGVLRNYLSKVQLTFGEVPMMEGESGSVELPLTSFGGRFGKGLTTPHDEFEVDEKMKNINYTPTYYYTTHLKKKLL